MDETPQSSGIVYGSVPPAAPAAHTDPALLAEIVKAHSVTAQGSLELARAVRNLTRWMMVLVMLLTVFVGATIYTQLRLEYLFRQTIQYYEEMLGPPEDFGPDSGTGFLPGLYDDGCLEQPGNDTDNSQNL